ncbi:MAG: DNA repair protein RecN [Chitinophagaceae bacterium]
MLTHLHIRNFAIIRELDIEFGPGLTILTGETGAGKSIIVGALSLLMGERADTQVLRDSQEKGILEARFHIEHLPQVQAALEAMEAEGGKELIIRREISAQGKSRVFIQDSPATLSQLIPLAQGLIDMHRQFDTIELQQQTEQLHWLDDIAGLNQESTQVQQLFKQWRKKHQELQVRQEALKTLQQEADYHQFLFDELEQFALKENEIEQLESEQDRLTNSEALQGALAEAVFRLNESPEPMVSSLKQLIQKLEPFAGPLPELQALLPRLQSVHIELKDIAGECDALQEACQPDAARLQQVQDRLSEAYRLLKKHHVEDSAGLIAVWETLREKVDRLAFADDDMQRLQADVNEAHQQYLTQAEHLSEKRRDAATKMQTAVNDLLPKVGMPNARFSVQHQAREAGESGIDLIQFMLDANRTGKFQPLAKAASGGELSRIMLCIKSLQAQSKSMPTLIFDEIDTGISGETAVQVGILMKQLAQHHQLLAITHLPSIAAKAHTHAYIYKQAGTDGVLETHIKNLSNEERIEVLAEMLGGKTNLAQSRETAKQLIAD